MPRALRIEYHGAIYHVMNRGDRREPIFQDDKDRSRLISIHSAVNGLMSAPQMRHNYTYNSANQRTRDTRVNGSYWDYTYDALGQVTSGKHRWVDGSLVAGQQFEYTFDTIGNRKQTLAGGDQSGAGLRPANYTNNLLNQITSRDVPGYADIMGVSIATNTVTVNGNTAYRKGEYFRNEKSVNNSSSALWTNIIVAATGQLSVTGNVFVAKSAEIFGYDADGNMTNDGRWLLTWDGENRLTKAESLSSGPAASKRKVTWDYDGKGRRIRQSTYDGSSGSYVTVEDLKLISDGWRNIAELNATNNALVRSYVWGLDLSGSMGGAGGVGGLLMMNSATNGTHFYAYDGNGNVAALVSGMDGTASANIEYDPFGRILRSTGAEANENRFCFSTKRNDRTTDFDLYEYRILRTDTGGWLSRDPMGERSDLNLSEFACNNPLEFIDSDGRQWLLAQPAIATPRPIFVPYIVPRPVFTPSPLPAPIPVPPPLFLPPSELPPSNKTPPSIPPVPSPNPNNDPSLDQFPDIPTDPSKAPKTCKPNCTPERLAELNRRVEEACQGGTPKCRGPGYFGGGDGYGVLAEKMEKIDACLRARERRERECFSGGDQKHVQQIFQLRTQRKNCDKIWNEKREDDFNRRYGPMT